MGSLEVSWTTCNPDVKTICWSLYLSLSLPLSLTLLMSLQTPRAQTAGILDFRKQCTMVWKYSTRSGYRVWPANIHKMTQNRCSTGLELLDHSAETVLDQLINKRLQLIYDGQEGSKACLQVRIVH